MRFEVLIFICGYARNVAFLVIDHTDASELHIARFINIRWCFELQLWFVYIPSLNGLILNFFLSECSKMNSSLYNILKSVVPSKSYLVAKGEAFHEYLPTLSQI